MVAPMGSDQQHIDLFAAGAAHHTGFLQKHVGGVAVGAAHRTSFLQLRNFQQLNESNNQQHHTGPGPKSLLRHVVDGRPRTYTELEQHVVEPRNGDAGTGMRNGDAERGCGTGTRNGVDRATAGWRYLMQPGDAWDPVETKSGGGLKLNRSANTGAAPVEFRGQWHKQGGYFYTGVMGISRLVCKDREGECPAAYLLHLQASTRDHADANDAALNANAEFLRQCSTASTAASSGELFPRSLQEFSDDEASVSGDDAMLGDGAGAKDFGEDVDEDMGGALDAFQAMTLKRNREADADEEAEDIGETGGRRTARRTCEG
eukprot:g4572.t1